MADNDTMEIAGKRTVADWKALRDKLGGTPALWNLTFDDFFMERLNTRYLHPIKLLQEYGENEGEGFSIVSLQCALIEFLQTTRDGASFKDNGGKYLTKSCKTECSCNPECKKKCNRVCQNPSCDCENHGKLVYGMGKSKTIFTKFLSEQMPFKDFFYCNVCGKGNSCKDKKNCKNKATDFYSNVRCSLLHEARTTGDWRITARKDRQKTIAVEDGITYLQRDLFQSDLEAYIWQYKIELLSNDLLKEAFIHKFNALCDLPIVDKETDTE